MALSKATGDFQTSVISTGSQLAAGGTTMTIGTGLILPATNGVLQIDYDSVAALGAASGPESVSYATYTSGTGAVTGMTRGLAGTTGVTHENGASVQCAPSAAYGGQGTILGTDLDTTAITLGYAQSVANFTDNTNAVVDVTGLSVAVTVPTGGRRMKITGWTGALANTAAAGTALNMYIREGATTLASSSAPHQYYQSCSSIASFIPTAGAHTYKISIQQPVAGGNVITMVSAATAPSFILVELI